MSLTKAIEHGKEPIMTDYSTIHGYPMRYESGGVTVEVDGEKHWFSMLWQALDFVNELEDEMNDVLRRVDNPDKGCWLKNHYVNETFRVWSLPQPPTAEELARWPWEEAGTE